MIFRKSYLPAIGLFLLMGCLLDTWHQDVPRSAETEEISLIQDWYRHAMLAERYSEGYRGPVVARMYAYLGIAGMEVAAGSRETTEAYDDLLRGMDRPESPSEPIHLGTALNACYATLLSEFFLMTAHPVQEDRNRTERRWSGLFGQHPDAELIERSVQWGERVARAVFSWAATDSIGHRAEFHNYDRSYVLPAQVGKWQPSIDHPMPPLLPHWGSVRTFATAPQEFSLAAPLEYSEQHGSRNYTQAYEAYAMSSPLSSENKWIAEFWSDDHPGLTISPAGRWISIAHQVIAQEKSTLSQVLETYLKTGVTLSDVNVTCWHWKYMFMSERPETYIPRVIDQSWQPLHHAPPFPGYPSGHSAMGAAVAEVLAEIYGPNVRLTDRTHEGRKEFRSEPRTFQAFHDMARENAFSRLALGVHFRADCEEGLRLGTLIGQAIAAIPIGELPLHDLSMNVR